MLLNHAQRELDWRDLTLLPFSCITPPMDPIRHMPDPVPSRLVFGSGVVYVPLAVAVARSCEIPRAGGLYLWTRHEFGAWPRLPLFLGVLDGDSVLVPDCRPSVYQGRFSMFGPLSAHWATTVSIFSRLQWRLIWIALGSNLIGLKVGKWTENIGALASGP